MGLAGVQGSGSFSRARGFQGSAHPTLGVSKQSRAFLEFLLLDPPDGKLRRLLSPQCCGLSGAPPPGLWVRPPFLWEPQPRHGTRLGRVLGTELGLDP